MFMYIHILYTCTLFHTHTHTALDAIIMSTGIPTPGALSPSVHPATFSFSTPKHTTHTTHPSHNPAHSPVLLSRRGSMKSIASPPLEGPPHSIHKQLLGNLSNSSLSNVHIGYGDRGAGHLNSEHPSDTSLVSERGGRYR